MRPADSDQILIQEILAGDQRAWSQLIDRYEGRLVAFAESRLRNRADAEDAVQETFMGFARGLANFDARRELQTYLFSIAANKITDVIRKRGRRADLPGSESPDERINEEADPGQLTGSNAARQAEDRQRESEAVGRALAGILHPWIARADYQRVQILELLFVKGVANKDVAKMLDVSEQHVANVRFAAVQKLAQQARGDEPARGAAR